MLKTNKKLINKNRQINKVTNLKLSFTNEENLKLFFT